MFNKQKSEQNKPKEAETVIGPSVKVKGNFHGDGNMIIDGIVEGNIKTKNNLYVGDKAKISANITAKEARIGGEINGNIVAKGHLEISASSRINGDIEAGSLSVERGAILNGRCTMGQAGKQETHEPKKS